MDEDDSCIYANIGGEMEYHPNPQHHHQLESVQEHQEQQQQQQQRDEMIIHPYNLVRARSSHCVLSGTFHRENEKENERLEEEKIRKKQKFRSSSA